jgi:hypothetical protein
MDELPRHQCLIYYGPPSEHIPHIGAHLLASLRSHHRCLYLNSPAMVAGMRSYLASAGVDVAEAIERGSLELSSATDHLRDGIFAVDEMLVNLSEAAHQAVADGYSGLFATGDMTWELGGEKNFDKLMEYEERLEDLLQATPALSGICQYHRQSLPDEAIRTAFHTHQAVCLNETLARMNPYYHAASRDVDDMLANDAAV